MRRSSRAHPGRGIASRCVRRAARPAGLVRNVRRIQSRIGLTGLRTATRICGNPTERVGIAHPRPLMSDASSRPSARRRSRRSAVLAALTGCSLVAPIGVAGAALQQPVPASAAAAKHHPPRHRPPGRSARRRARRARAADRCPARRRCEHPRRPAEPCGPRPADGRRGCAAPPRGERPAGARIGSVDARRDGGRRRRRWREHAPAHAGPSPRHGHRGGDARLRGDHDPVGHADRDAAARRPAGRPGRHARRHRRPGDAGHGRRRPLRARRPDGPGRGPPRCADDPRQQLDGGLLRRRRPRRRAVLPRPLQRRARRGAQGRERDDLRARRRRWRHQPRQQGGAVDAGRAC